MAPQLIGKEVGQIGFGLMGFTWRPEPVSQKQSFETMRAALEEGATFWNGGEFYGTPDYNSLHLLNQYFSKYPEDADKVIISIKGGANPKTLAPEGHAEGVRRSVDTCLKLLDGKKKLDMFECARVDPKTPIEVSIRTLAEYIKAGKLGGISLSECGEDTIRRAAKVHKISGVEVEFSLFSTEILENGVAKACAELGIPIIAYSPLGRGFLTGQIQSIDDLDKDDMRRHLPRFQPGNFEKNMELVHEVEVIAKKKGCTPGQVAIAWCNGYNGRPGMPEIIPIPGSSAVERLRENSKVVTLSSAEMEELDAIVKKCVIHGERYHAAINHLNFGESPVETA